MDKTNLNKCFRCGRKLVVSKTWEETFETQLGATFTEIHSISICPDATCQDVMDKEMAFQKDKRDKQKQERERNAQIRKDTNQRNRKKVLTTHS